MAGIWRFILERFGVLVLAVTVVSALQLPANIAQTEKLAKSRPGAVTIQIEPYPAS
jgi:hypothetical protein